MSMMDFLLRRRETSLSNVIDTQDATDINSTKEYIAFHYDASWFENEDALASFDQEVEILMSVRHPWLLTPHQVVKDGKERLLCYQPFSVEKSLYEQQGELAPDTLLDIFDGLNELAALFHMKKAFCYFDPVEIFVSESPFSLKWLRLPRAFLSLTTQSAPGGIFGSPAYRSPAQVEGEDMKPEDDTFVLAAMLLGALTGEAPFRGKSPSEVLMNILGGQVKGLDHPSVQPEMRRLLEDMLALDAQKRLKDPDAIHEGLQIAFGKKAPPTPEPEPSEAAEATSPAPENTAEATSEVKLPEGEKVVEEPANEAPAPAEEPAKEPAEEPVEEPMAVDAPAKEPSIEEAEDSFEPPKEALESAESDEPSVTGEAEEPPVVAEDEAKTASDEERGQELATEKHPAPSLVEEEDQPSLPDMFGEKEAEHADLASEDDGEGLSEGASPEEGNTKEEPSDTAKLVPPEPPVESGLLMLEEPTNDPLTDTIKEKKKKLQEEASSMLDGLFNDMESGTFSAPIIPDLDVDALLSPNNKKGSFLDDLMGPRAPAAPAPEENAPPLVPSLEEVASESEPPQDELTLEGEVIEEAGGEALNANADAKAEVDAEVEEEEEASEEASEELEALEPVGEVPALEGAVPALEPEAPSEKQKAPVRDLFFVSSEEKKQAEETSKEANSSPSLSALAQASASSLKQKGASKGKKQISLRRAPMQTDTLEAPAPVEVEAPSEIEPPDDLDLSAPEPHQDTPSHSLLDLVPEEPEAPAAPAPAPASAASGSSSSLPIFIPNTDADVALNEMADMGGGLDDMTFVESESQDRLDVSSSADLLADAEPKPKPTSEPEPEPEPKPEPPKVGELDELLLEDDLSLQTEVEAGGAKAQVRIELRGGAGAPTAGKASATMELEIQDQEVDETPLLPPEPAAPVEEPRRAKEEPAALPPKAQEAPARQEKPKPKPPAPVAEKPREKVVKTLRRKANVRYYKQMNPGKIFPLLVTVLEAELYVKVPEIAGVKQAESDKVMKIKESSPLVKVVPVIPGSLVSPAEVILDVRQPKVDAEFWVAPQSLGNLEPSARVQIWHEGELKDEIKLPIHIRKQTWTRVMGSVSMMSTFSGLMLKAFGSSKPPVDSGVSAKIAKGFVDFLASSGLWMGIVFLLASVGCYFWLRPQKGDEIEQFLSTDLH